MVHDWSEWWGFVRENTTTVSCHSGRKPLNGGSRLWSSLQLKGMKEKEKLKESEGRMKLKYKLSSIVD